jgi:hypothetical protein
MLNFPYWSVATPLLVPLKTTDAPGTVCPDSWAVTVPVIFFPGGGFCAFAVIAKAQ